MCRPLRTRRDVRRRLRRGERLTALPAAAEERNSNGHSGDGDCDERGDADASRTVPDPRRRRGRGDGRVLPRREPRVVLLGVQRAVEAEELGVLAQEAARVHLAGQLLEPVVLERLEVPPSDPQRLLHRVELEAATDPCFAEAASDLEHAAVLPVSSTCRSVQASLASGRPPVDPSSAALANFSPLAELTTIRGGRSSFGPPLRATTGNNV